MLKPVGKEAIPDIIDKLSIAKFACKVRSAFDDDEDADVDDDKDNESKIIMIVMNQTYKDLLTKLNIATVGTANKLGNLYEIILGNFEFMVNGNAEGLVLVSPTSGYDVQISKWKIGAEANETNKDFIFQMLLDIEDRGGEIFGENAAKALELFGKM